MMKLLIALATTVALVAPAVAGAEGNYVHPAVFKCTFYYRALSPVPEWNTIGVVVSNNKIAFNNGVMQPILGFAGGMLNFYDKRLILGEPPYEPSLFHCQEIDK